MKHYAHFRFAVAALLAAGAFILSGQASAQPAANATPAPTQSVQKSMGYSDFVVKGDDVYFAGVVATLGPGDTLEAAYERQFARLDKILHNAGVDWSDVVDMLSFHTDVIEQAQPFIAVKKRYLKDNEPTWTAIGISRLIGANNITEVKLIAKKKRP